MSDGCGGRWTGAGHTRSSTRCAEWGFAFVLLTRTLKSSTFRLAAICIAVFSGTVFALLGYVYWATTDYVHRQSDRAIAADRASLVQTYERTGRDGLASLVGQRVAGRELEAGIYVLLDPSRRVLAGNLRSWPPTLRDHQGWADFELPEAAGHILLRATYETLPDGSPPGRPEPRRSRSIRGDHQDRARLRGGLDVCARRRRRCLRDPAHDRTDRSHEHRHARDHAEPARQPDTASRHEGRMGPAGREPQRHARSDQGAGERGGAGLRQRGTRSADAVDPAAWSTGAGLS